MGKIGHTRAAALTPLAAQLEARGVSVAGVFGDAGLPPGLLGVPALPIRLTDHYAILDAAARRCGDACFGAALGAAARTETLGPYGRFVTGAPVLGAAIARAGAALNAHMQSATDLQLTPQGARLRWEMVFHTPGHEGRRQNELLALGYLIDTLRGYLGPGWRPSLLRVPLRQRRDIRRAELLFGAPVVASDHGAAVEFPAAALGAHHRDLRAAAPGLDATESEWPMPESGFTAATRAAIHLELLSGPPLLPQVANRLGLSPRSLQRHLAATGESFARLRDAERLRRAATLLLTDAAPLTDIAENLGYSDAAHFHRAFRRWSGQTPGAFRRGAELTPAPAP